MKLRGAENEVSCDFTSPWKWLDQCTCWPLGIRLLEVSFSHFLEERVGTEGKVEWGKLQPPPVRLPWLGSWSSERRGCRQKKNKSLHQWLNVKGPFLWSPSNKLWCYIERGHFSQLCTENSSMGNAWKMAQKLWELWDIGHSPDFGFGKVASGSSGIVSIPLEVWENPRGTW